MEMTTESLGGDIVRIALDGRLDIEGSQKIDLPFSVATTSREGRFVVDLTSVSFIASIGIRLLLTAARGQLRRGGKMVLIPPAGPGGEVLKTSGVDLVVPLVPDLAAARDALGATG
jgi:anti-anti-sigma factor